MVAFVDWAKYELTKTDRRTRKKLNLNVVFPWGSSLRSYLPRKENWSIFISIESCVDISNIGIDYWYVTVKAARIIERYRETEIPNSWEPKTK